MGKGERYKQEIEMRKWWIFTETKFIIKITLRDSWMKGYNLTTKFTLHYTLKEILFGNLNNY
jgi:hypothetical protein